MFSKKNHRWVLVVPSVLLLLVVAVPVQAAGPGGLASLWSWIGRWTGLAAPAIGTAAQRLSSSTGQSDSGPEIDPNGWSSSTGQSDQGPEIDPNGRPR